MRRSHASYPTYRKVLVSEIPVSQSFWGIFKLYGVNLFSCVLGLSGNVHPNGVEPKTPADQSGLHTLGRSQISQKKHNIGGSEKTY